MADYERQATWGSVPPLDDGKYAAPVRDREAPPPRNGMPAPSYRPRPFTIPAEPAPVPQPRRRKPPRRPRAYTDTECLIRDLPVSAPPERIWEWETHGEYSR